LAAGYVGDYADVVLDRPIFFDGFDVVDARPLPRIIEQILACNKRDVPTGIVTLFKELVSFVLARNTNDVFLHSFDFILRQKNGTIYWQKQRKIFVLTLTKLSVNLQIRHFD
jgi:hypothetical protein